MNAQHEGLSIWYGTPDAPAPTGDSEKRSGLSMLVGVQPPSPINTVTIRYRVDGGLVQSIPARQVRTDYPTASQYFVGIFPPFEAGDETVRYEAVMACAGRQVPAAGQIDRFPSSFRLAPPAPERCARPAAPATGGAERPASRFAPDLRHVCRVTAQLRGKGEVIGPCPDGLRINFYVDGGRAVGPGFDAIIRPGGCDSMIIRRDGIGGVRLRAVLETHDGALIAADYEGLFQLGEHGYDAALLGRFPEKPPVQLAPRFYTANARYLWVNRTQFVGVGHVVMAESRVEYDLYAVGTGA
jgi:hypothetical protein